MRLYNPLKLLIVTKQDSLHKKGVGHIHLSPKFSVLGVLFIILRVNRCAQDARVPIITFLTFYIMLLITKASGCPIWCVLLIGIYVGLINVSGWDNLSGWVNGGGWVSMGGWSFISIKFTVTYQINIVLIKKIVIYSNPFITFFMKLMLIITFITLNLINLLSFFNMLHICVLTFQVQTLTNHV